MKILKPISKLVEKKPVVAIVIIVVITMMMIAATMLIPYDSEFDESQWVPDNEVVTVNDEVNEKFKSDDQAVNVNMIVHAQIPKESPNILTVEAMKDIVRLEWAISNDSVVSENLNNPTVPAENFMSLPHLIALFAYQEPLDFPGLMQLYQGMTQKQFMDILAQARTIPQLNESISMLLSTDFRIHDNSAKATLIIVHLNGSENQGNNFDSRIYKAETGIDSAAHNFESELIDPFVLSQAKLDDGFKEAEENMAFVLLPLAFIMIVVVLFVTYRSFSDLAFSLIALVFTLIWVSGTITLLGFKNSPLIQAVPIFLIGLGVDYGIHLTMRYREELVVKNNVNRCISITIMSVGAALILGALTDMVGFLSNTSSSIQVIREFGIIVSLGIIYAFAIFVIFVPSCKILLDRHKMKKCKPLLSQSNRARATNKNGELQGFSARFAKFMDNGAKIALKMPKAALTIIVAGTLVMLLLATQLPTGFSSKDFLSEGSELKEEYMFLEDNFAFSEQEAVIYIRAKDVANYKILTAVHKVQQNIRDDRHTVIKPESPSSPLTVMQDYADPSDIMLGGKYDPEFAVIWIQSNPDPDNIPRDNISALFDWLWINHPSALSNTLYRENDGGYSILLIRVIANSRMAEVADEVHEDLKEDVIPLNEMVSQEKLDKVVVTGVPVIEDVILTTINESMITSLAITLVVSLITLTIVFYLTARSMVLGLITMIPVIFVLIWVLGTMFILSIPLNVVTVIIAAISIGLGINYAIHISHRFVEELNGHNKINKATHQTVKSTGTALFSGAATTMVGFGVLAFSVQIPFRQFGTMMALTIFFSFLASVFVLPSMLVLWAKATSKARLAHRNTEISPRKKGSFVTRCCLLIDRVLITPSKKRSKK
jgi:predicted RND superfamily exporter protein